MRFAILLAVGALFPVWLPFAALLALGQLFFDWLDAMADERRSRNLFRKGG